MTAVLQSVAVIAALLILVVFWPLAQRLRHDRLSAIAAYLLFTSVFALVGAGVFMLLFGLGVVLLPQGAMDGPLAASVTVLLVLLPALAAAVRIVRRPQIRRMPR